MLCLAKMRVQGRLAGKLGLVGAVAAKDFARLSQGEHPQTGEQLVNRAVSVR